MGSAIERSIRKALAQGVQAQKEQETHFRKELDDAEAWAAEIRTKYEASRRASERASRFQLERDGHFQCPRCWIENELHVRLVSPESDTDEDSLWCRECGLEIPIED